MGSGDAPHNHESEKRIKLVIALDEIARKYGVSRPVMALAWVMRHPSKTIPIVGSTNPENIQEAVGADEVELEREDWYNLLVAARAKALP